MTHELAGSRVLITGGAGFVGSHIADALIDAGVAEVIAIDNLVRGNRQHLASASARGRVTFVEGDIRDRELVADCMQGVDYVYHDAALRITQCAEAPREAHTVMMDGAVNILALTSDVSDMYFNVASGTQTTLSELSTRLCEVMGRPELRAEHFEERKVNPVRHRLGGTTLARERLGFETTVSLRAGLERLVEWRRAEVRRALEVVA